MAEDGEGEEVIRLSILSLIIRKMVRFMTGSEVEVWNPLGVC